MSVFTDERLARLQMLMSQAENILITCHKSPDGDAIGSALGLHHYLGSLGHASTVVVPDAVPEFLHWLPGFERIIDAESDPEHAAQAIRQADLIFHLDHNDPSRTGGLEPVLSTATAPRVMIDHHLNPSDFAEVTFCDTESCSTAQLITELAEAREELHHISPDAAVCIYTGIVTDTGSFRFSSVTSKTHRLVADLMDRGLQHDIVHRTVYDTNRLERLRLIGHALSNKLEVIPEFATAIISLDAEELNAFGYRKGDTEGLVNYGLSLGTVTMAVFIREGNNAVKMSFRSKGDFAVNELAAAHFSGGGHRNAAGGISEATVEETVAKVKALLPEYNPQNATV